MLKKAYEQAVERHFASETPRPLKRGVADQRCYGGGSAANTAATGVPTISGTAQVGETLTAETSGISDADGLTNVNYSYQWLASRDTEISGATSSTYTLQASDNGKVIKVRVTFTDDAGNEETLTSASTEAIAAIVVAETLQQRVVTQNSPATGAPAISGTPEVGQTLSADTSSINDADGLANASFAYQWISNDGTADTVIQDAAGTAYSIESEDLGKTIKVRVSFADDAGNSETLASASTATVEAALTAEFDQAPESHNGSRTFTFELRFSENLNGFSYKTLRDHAFQVTDGVVTKARRLERPSNILWQIPVKPSSESDVTIVLPATEDCAAVGAICTEDGHGRKLSNRLELTVSGP